MKRILILHYYSGYFDGTFTSMVDLYNNLLDYNIDVEFKIITQMKISESVTSINKNFKQTNLLNLTIDKCFDADTIVCSSCLLYNHFSFPINSLELKANRIIVLDSVDNQLSKAHIKTKYGLIPPLETKIHDHNCIFLCNPSNIGSCSLKTYIYYHKLSEKRLNNLKHKEKILDSMEDYKTYTYNRLIRHKKYKDMTPVWYENIGKVIFESIYFGLEVNYLADGFVLDGLNYYLKLFDIDPTINHFPLPITPDDIENVLFMKETDLLLDLLKE